uniref:Uncharacterized protein n=1 Tax=Physcomitrium patens TaxID=3218 RepID=A0A7I4C4X9_PHYPA
MKTRQRHRNKDLAKGKKGGRFSWKPTPLQHLHSMHLHLHFSLNLLAFFSLPLSRTVSIASSLKLLRILLLLGLWRFLGSGVGYSDFEFQVCRGLPESRK